LDISPFTLDSSGQMTLPSNAFLSSARQILSLASSYFWRSDVSEHLRAKFTVEREHTTRLEQGLFNAMLFIVEGLVHTSDLNGFGRLVNGDLAVFLGGFVECRVLDLDVEEAHV
jgi:hypothetical protein